MPQSTTALPTGPEQPKPNQPRVEIPVADEPQPRPRRRARPPEPEQADADALAYHADDRAPKLEPWLTVLLVSLALAVLALFVPRPVRPTLYVATGAVMLAGLVMLFVEERRHAAHRRRVGEHA